MIFNGLDTTQLKNIKFLKRLTIPRKFLPINYTTKLEESNLTLNSGGRIKQIHDKQQKMFILAFIVNGVLIRQILLITRNNIGDKITEGTERNLKHLASIVYYTGVLQKLMRSDGVRGGVYLRREMNVVLKGKEDGRVVDILGKCSAWFI